MGASSRSGAAGLGRFVSSRVFQVALLAVLALVLFGAVPEGRLALLLGLFVVARGLFLVAEARRRRVTAAEWQGLQADLFGRYSRLAPEEREAEALALDLGPAASTDELARAALAELRSGYTAPRAGRELACEGLGLVGYALLLPAGVILFTHDFVSLRGSLGWAGLGVAGVCIALYAWPLLWKHSIQRSRRRMLWWALPFVPGVAVLVAGIGLRHPYLDPTRDDRVQLAAERVLTLENNIVAGRHADWVFAYAQELERRGEPELAARTYRAGLRFDPTDAGARARLALLETGRSPRREAPPAPGAPGPAARARAPLWSEGDVAPAQPRCGIDASLGEVEGTLVVLVRVGDVPDGLVDAVGAVIERELGLPTCIARRSIALPPHTRVRGLVVGRQWSLRSLLQTFLFEVGTLPSSPAKLVLLTNADIFEGEANFVFSGTYPWGAVVSFARFGEGAPESPEIIGRAAKQTLGALLKSFGLPMSTDSDCVTSYSNGLDQFDAKGNRPNAETLALFRRALRSRNESWTAAKAARAYSPDSPQKR